MQVGTRLLGHCVTPTSIVELVAAGVVARVETQLNQSVAALLRHELKFQRQPQGIAACGRLIYDIVKLVLVSDFADS